MSMQTSADSAAGAPLWACALVKISHQLQVIELTYLKTITQMNL